LKQNKFKIKAQKQNLKIQIQAPIQKILNKLKDNKILNKKGKPQSVFYIKNQKVITIIRNFGYIA